MHTSLRIMAPPAALAVAAGLAVGAMAAATAGFHPDQVAWIADADCRTADW
jgi:hypothetical protein